MLMYLISCYFNNLPIDDIQKKILFCVKYGNNDGQALAGK